MRFPHVSSPSLRPVVEASGSPSADYLVSYFATMLFDGTSLPGKMLALPCEALTTLRESLKEGTAQKHIIRVLDRMGNEMKGFIRIVKADGNLHAIHLALGALYLFARLVEGEGQSKAGRQLGEEEKPHPSSSSPDRMQIPVHSCHSAQRLVDSLLQQISRLSLPCLKLLQVVTRNLLICRRLTVTSKQRNRILEYFLNPAARPLAPLAVRTDDRRATERSKRREEEEDEDEERLRAFARGLGLTPSGLHALVE
ncbi:polynucleotide adenylyltransferase, partial [Cystoisospora suis]